VVDPIPWRRTVCDTGECGDWLVPREATLDRHLAWRRRLWRNSSESRGATDAAISAAGCQGAGVKRAQRACAEGARALAEIKRKRQQLDERRNGKK